MAGWVVGGYPGGSIEVTTGDNFPWKQAPCKLVLHTTEGGSYPNWGYNKSSHVTIHPRQRTWRQHRRLDQPAWTLKAPAGAVSTNSMGAIQIEIIGYAATIKDLDGDDLAYLIGFIRFILAQTGIQATCTVLFGGNETAGVNGKYRMSAAAWTAYRGILGHQHVPNNDHWDPGDIPMQAKWLPMIQGGSVPVPVEDDDMPFLIKIAAPGGKRAIISSVIGWRDTSAAGVTEYYEAIALSLGFTVSSRTVDENGWIMAQEWKFPGVTSIPPAVADIDEAALAAALAPYLDDEIDAPSVAEIVEGVKQIQYQTKAV